MTLQIKQVFLKTVLISLRFYGYYRSKCHHFSSIDHSMSVLDGYWMTLWLIIIILYSDQNTTVIFTCWALYLLKFTPSWNTSSLTSWSLDTWLHNCRCTLSMFHTFRTLSDLRLVHVGRTGKSATGNTIRDAFGAGVSHFSGNTLNHTHDGYRSMCHIA